jgi:septum formation protein
MSQPSSTSLILASASRARALLLQQAGVRFQTLASDLCEQDCKSHGASHGWAAPRVALELALRKAQCVAAQRPGTLILGADQMLECEGHWYDKPLSLEDAKAHLWALRGKVMSLPTAAVLLYDHVVLWACVETPLIQFRDYSEAFLNQYLQQSGEKVLQAVGACAVEQEGLQLIRAIDGNLMTVNGLPMLCLLQALRTAGHVMT